MKANQIQKNYTTGLVEHYLFGANSDGAKLTVSEGWHALTSVSTSPNCCPSMPCSHQSLNIFESCLVKQF